MVDFDNLDPVMDKVGGMPVAYGLQFRPGKPFTTLHFERGNGESVHLYVYVDKDYLPVAMALVHPPTPCVEYREVPRDGAEYKKLVTDLYGFLCQLSAWAKSFRKPAQQTDALAALAKATDNVKRLEAVEMKKAA